MRPVRWCALALATLLTTVATAAPITALDRLLLEPQRAAELRARLAAHAGSIAAKDPDQAARALTVLGRSALRAGLADSAVEALSRSFATQASVEAAASLAQALLERGRPGDALAARACLVTTLAGTEAPADRAALSPWLARALERLGRADSALVVWRDYQPRGDAPGARRRQALALARSSELSDRAAARDVLLRLASSSRGHDVEVLQALLGGLIEESRVRDAIGRQSHVADAAELRELSARGAAPITFAGTDGVALVGATRPAAGAGLARAAVVILAPGEALVAADSLAERLAGAGYAVMTLQPRGSGHSVSPEWPGTWAVEERPEAWTTAGAGDVAVAVRVLARARGCDTTRVLLAADGSSVAIAARAAARDARVRAVVLTSPAGPDEMRAPALAELAGRQAAVFVQIAPEDYLGAYDFSDALFRVGAAGHARLSETQLAPTGLEQWRADAACRERLTRWLSEPLPAAPNATPPARRRRG